MFYKIIKYLKNTPTVSEIKVIELIEEDSVKILKLKIKLKDNSYLFITEVHTINHQKYSYHWQDETGNLLIRWDNSPHWKNIKTFPHHKHIGSEVLPSTRVTIEDVFQEIERYWITKEKSEKIKEGKN